MGWVNDARKELTAGRSVQIRSIFDPPLPKETSEERGAGDAIGCHRYPAPVHAPASLPMSIPLLSPSLDFAIVL